MNRRSFIRRLGISVVATAALASVPASWIKRSAWLADSGKDWAIERLYKAYHTFHSMNSRTPQIIKVSPYMLAMYESELQVNQRFVSVDLIDQGIKALAFKGTWVISHGKNTDHIEVM